MVRKVFILICITLINPLSTNAQTFPEEGLFSDDYRLSPDMTSTLRLSIENLSFFENMEADGVFFKGYSLPGLKLLPRLIYQPFEKVSVEAGLSLLRYWGIDKYPNFAYRNIPEWKADHYQLGFHLLPFFRAQIRPFDALNIVFGNIYGGGNHRLPDFMYNRELNLTADPEQGFQILLDTRFLHLDTWINWETFIFNNSPHDEVFTLGTSATLNLNSPESSFHTAIPLNIAATHHGGEIDVVHGTVETIINAATGLNMAYNANFKRLRNVNLDLLYTVFSTDANEGKYPFKQGYGFYSKLSADITNTTFKLAYWQSKNYINNFGLPVFGNISTVSDGVYFPDNKVINIGVDYECQLGKSYNFGFSAEFFYLPDNTNKSASTWYAGAYLRINPSIMLKN